MRSSGDALYNVVMLFSILKWCYSLFLSGGYSLFILLVLSRAPERVLEARRGSVYPLQLSQTADSSTAEASPAPGFIGMLDLAEAVVQALLIDVAQVMSSGDIVYYDIS